MGLRSRRTIIAATGMAVVYLIGVARAGGQAGAEQKPPMAEEVFKNVQVLKGIPVNDFMGTMGIFSGALGMTCTDCHAGGDTWDTYASDNPRKLTARKMVLMMNQINRANFGGRQVVTCYTCHRGSNHPTVTPNLETLYNLEPDSPDILAPASGAPSADQVFDKYLQALGGAQRLATITSFVGTGTSVGFGPESDKRPFEVVAKAPGQRTTITHTLDGDSITTYDGHSAWIAAPHNPVPVLVLSGGDLDGARLDAALSFPAQIRQALGKWRVGPVETIDDRDVQVVQGTSAGGSIATLYFDKESGLLVRQVRYTESPVGRIPTQIDYGDYRVVSGVKMPFRWTVAWMSGQDTVELTEIQVNVPIDAAKFARPAAPTAPRR